LAFVVVFEHFVFFTKVAIESLITDVPKSVQLAVKRENFLAQEALDSQLSRQEDMQRRMSQASKRRRESNVSGLQRPGPSSP